MRVYNVSEEDREKVLAFVAILDLKTISTEVMHELFAALEMRYDFKLLDSGKE